MPSERNRFAAVPRIRSRGPPIASQTVIRVVAETVTRQQFRKQLAGVVAIPGQGQDATVRLQMQE